MACRKLEETFQKNVRSAATSPHGLACAKARIEWTNRAARTLRRLEREAETWRDETQCPNGCVKTGSGQIAVSNRRPRAIPKDGGNSCVCVGSVSVEAWIDCEEPKTAALLEEGEVESFVTDEDPAALERE